MTPEQVVDAMWSAGKAAAGGSSVEPKLIAAAVRRAAAALCPCSMASLSAEIAQSMAFLPGADGAEFRQRLDEVIEQLVVHGDLLELPQVVAPTAPQRGAQIHVAPVAFVRLSETTIRLLGIAPDDLPPLPAILADRIVERGLARTITGAENENLAAQLRDFGIPELTIDAWLRTPTCESSAAFVGRIEKKLDNASDSGEIDDLEILDWTRQTKSYRKRWGKPVQQEGTFVARRPQAYGAPLWGIVQLAAGRPRKFLDFPLKGDPYRGCDNAWRFQMAIDANRGEHQTYRADKEPGVLRLRLYSPIPAWAQRRLVVLGDSISPKEALVDVRIPDKESAGVERFLAELLWLKPGNGQEGEADG